MRSSSSIVEVNSKNSSVCSMRKGISILLQSGAHQLIFYEIRSVQYAKASRFFTTFGSVRRRGAEEKRQGREQKLLQEGVPTQEECFLSSMHNTQEAFFEYIQFACGLFAHPIVQHSSSAGIQVFQSVRPKGVQKTSDFVHHT